MPKRTDIKKILIIGSGPIVIGQGGEFDYAASQACKALREEGYETILVDSNPATVSTDPSIADRAYIEPLDVASITKIIEKELPNAILPIVGGQTALYMVASLEREGILEKFNVKVIGTCQDAIFKVEDRKLFKGAMQNLRVPTPRSGCAASIEQGMQTVRDLGFPAVLKPAYTIGGAGSGTAYNVEEFVTMLSLALETSPVRRVTLEQSAAGWKEADLIILRDSADNVSVVSVLEDIGPVGVHTGDTVVVTPAQTIDKSILDNLTELAKNVVRGIDIIGIADIRFAINKDNGDILIIGVNPRTSRSSAFASKATGIPIAYIAAKLAVGITLDELNCKLTASTDNCCAVKLPRFAFDKFPQADTTLDTSMKAVGEVMAIGRNFKEALQKGIRSLQIGRYGLGSDGKDSPDRNNLEIIQEKLVKPNPERLFFIRYALENGISVEEIAELAQIDPWFVQNVSELIEFEKKLQGKSLVSVSADVLQEAKALGYSDAQLAALLETDEEQVRIRRKVLGIESTFAAIEAKFVADENKLACLYSTYNAASEANTDDSNKKVIIIGSGPNRIGQGLEFDYCCVEGSLALKEEGYESIIINCAPGTVSTDFQFSDRIYIEPLVLENVLDVIKHEKPMGVIAQLGGWTAINMCMPLKKSGVDILGTSPELMDRARDRKYLNDLASKLNLRRMENAVATTAGEALKFASKTSYPLIVKSENTYSGRAVDIVYDDEGLSAFMDRFTGTPVLIEKFLEDAIEIGIDAISDGETTLVCGVMEHIEQSGVHSGDSACSMPPYSISDNVINEIKGQTYLLAKELKVRGLINVQFSVKSDEIYLLDLKLRASRTIPFISKATKIPWAKVATKIMLGKTLKDQGITQEITPKQISVKEAVFPFVRFPGVDVVLGPEMKSTGAVMGMDENFGSAYIKAEIAAGQNLLEKGTAFVSVADRDKSEVAKIGKKLKELGFDIVATKGTAKALAEAGVDVKVISKIGEGRPDATDLIKNDEVDLIINTLSGKKPRKHEVSIRSTMVARGIPIVTTIAGAKATLLGMEALRNR